MFFWNLSDPCRKFEELQQAMRSEEQQRDRTEGKEEEETSTVEQLQQPRTEEGKKEEESFTVQDPQPTDKKTGME